MALLHNVGNPIHNGLVLLAPEGGSVPASFTRRSFGPGRHAAWLSEAQKVRGTVYLQDGAVEASQLTADGRHVQTSDSDSWHLLAVDGNGEVQGCARYRHLTGNISFDDLGVGESSLARCDRWGRSLRAAVESEIVRARCLGMAISEVGGWAIVPEKRCTATALRVAIATYSLAQLLGGCVGLSTATERHSSSSILRRIGGRSLVYQGTELPSYYDPDYRCRMEILRFDSSSPDAACGKLVERLSKRLAEATVVIAREPAESQYTPRFGLVA